MTKKTLIFCVLFNIAIIFLLTSCCNDFRKISTCNGLSNISEKYCFNGSISEEVLRNYLSRAITQGDLCHSVDDAQFYEDIRMLRNIGAKFIGRAAFIWTPLKDNDEHYKIVRKRAKQAHQIDPEFLLQCCLFEAVFHSSNELTDFGVDTVKIPRYVFEEFNIDYEDRNFDYNKMLYDENKLEDSDYLFHDHWVKGGSVPDMASIETQMYFFYQAVEYIDAGFESIHLGQIMLMNDNDPDNAITFSLLNRIRRYAQKNARRNFVMFDAHVPAGFGVSEEPHGIVDENGVLMFDFHSFPTRAKEICGQPFHTILEVGHYDAIYNNSMGGITPSGWKCDSLPYLVELDNSGAANPGICGGKEWWWPWGRDEISWFAHCDTQYRNRWLRYAHSWVRKTDPQGYLQMPGSTTIASDPIGDIYVYKTNMQSEDCPNGFGQEETIKQIWAEK